MDGLEERGRITVIGTTNRIDAVDPALRRPGRFDREIEIGVPDRDGREEILSIHTRGMALTDDVDLGDLAERTDGYVGADIGAVCREAAATAVREYVHTSRDGEPSSVEDIVLTSEHFEQALDDVGPSGEGREFGDVGGFGDVDPVGTEAE